MTNEQLCALALQAIDGADARVVLADALHETGWDDPRLIPWWRDENVETSRARSIAAVLLFGDWPTRWELAERCVYGSRHGDGWWGYVDGHVPVQGYGEVDDVFWYFRARGESWSFDVYAGPTDTTEGLPGNDAFVWGTDDDWGDGPFAAGWMPHEEAWRLIEGAFASYRQARQRQSDDT